MRNFLYLFASFVISVFTFYGCDDFVDVKPKGQIIPQSVDDYRKILDLVPKSNVGRKVTILRTYGIANFLSDNYQIGTQEQYDALQANSARLQKFNWAEGEFLYPEDEEDIDWETLYGQIYIMNSVLEGVPDADGPTDQKNILMAEARVHRAFCYLALINIYAKHYRPESAASDPGVFLRLGVSLSEPLERASVQEVYDVIIRDLTMAIPDLPSVQDFNHRPTKAAAHGLLARVYLYQGRYGEALEQATQCLAIKDELYDLNEVLELDDPMSEQYNSFANPDHQSWDDIEVILQKTTATRTVSGDSYHHQNFTTVEEVLEPLYDWQNDLRFRFYFEPDTSEETGDTLFYTYVETSRKWEDAWYPFVGISVPEILLIRAEVNARTGNKSAAISDLNILRKKRFLSENFMEISAAELNEEEVIEFIKAERRRELMFKGLRWFDLKRYNAIEGANISIQRFFTGDMLSPGDQGWVMPINDLYLDN